MLISLQSIGEFEQASRLGHHLCGWDFRYLPCQLFTINGFINGQQFPLVYSFLPTKSRADYNRFFTIVKEEMQNQGLTFQPIAIMSDFELASLHLEGWHFRLNKLASKKHLNLFEVIELIKQEQAATDNSTRWKWRATS